MNKRIKISILCAGLLIIPKEGWMSTWIGTEKAFAGFSLQSSRSFGHPGPGTDMDRQGEEMDRARIECKKNVEESEKSIRQLYDFYRAGHHPYQGLQWSLNPEAPPKVKKAAPDQVSSEDDGNRRMEPNFTLYWDGGNFEVDDYFRKQKLNVSFVFIHLKKEAQNIPDRLASDFVLSQFSPGGPLHNLPPYGKDFDKDWIINNLSMYSPSPEKIKDVAAIVKARTIVLDVAKNKSWLTPQKLSEITDTLSRPADQAKAIALIHVDAWAAFLDNRPFSDSVYDNLKILQEYDLNDAVSLLTALVPRDQWTRFSDKIIPILKTRENSDNETAKKIMEIGAAFK